MSALEVNYITFQPTTYCNLDCAYCYLPHRKIRKRAPLELVREVTKQLVDQRLVNPRVGLVYAWHNCEPLTVHRGFYEEAFELIRDLLPDGVPSSHRFVSNGTLMDEAWANFFAEHGITPTISLDGPRELHDGWRRDIKGRDTHARAVSGYQRLLERGLTPPVICVLRDASLSYPREIFEFFRDLGAKVVGFSCEEVEGINKRSTMAGATERYGWFLRNVLRLNDEAGQPLRFREVERFRGAIFEQRSVRVAVLRPGAYLSVDVDGNLSGWCPEMLGWDEFVIGNVWQDRIRDAFEGPLFLQQQEEIEAGIAACRSECAYFDVCGGGEPTNKFHEHGTFRATETLQCLNATQATFNAVLAHFRGEPPPPMPQAGVARAKERLKVLS